MIVAPTLSEYCNTLLDSRLPRIICPQMGLQVEGREQVRLFGPQA